MDAAISASTGLTILVTGAQSALGQAVVERLVRSGHKVYGSVKTADSASRLRQAGGVALFIDLSRATEIQANIKLQGIQVIVNLEPQQVNQVPYHKTAWDGAALLAQTAAIVQAAAAAGVQYLVHTSYAFVYGDQHGAWVDETAKPHTEGRELLRAALQAEKVALTGNVPASALRLGFVYSANSEGLRAVVDTMRAGRPVLSDKGYAGWIHADDAAEAVRRAVVGQPVGEIFNVVDDAPATSEGFLNDLATSMGVQAPGGVPGFMSRFYLSPAQLDLMKLSSKPRNTKLKTMLGWEPRFPIHTAGIEDILLTWRSDFPIAPPITPAPVTPELVTPPLPEPAQTKAITTTERNA